ncbi:uncharacterized protein PHALS_15360 [Plasmopara halstedii]|uniref:Uncharacterized protein n=1 Tax=Plasmopara halstedii TaxID=4781 RepID=A0A0P1ADU2_PLAHL|nr:uncharacterized protein PHALS_15360 [Plasmopara halstedii]CEG39156.1 hypothetical protein PHALS_15360 [Plasmopara halstedii]|eukprot:XP_024575525.1 hypothetical protein PHALS_15360 [Plasmopara halstedii]
MDQLSLHFQNLRQDERLKLSFGFNVLHTLRWLSRRRRGRGTYVVGLSKQESDLLAIEPVVKVADTLRIPRFVHRAKYCCQHLRVNAMVLA